MFGRFTKPSFHPKGLPNLFAWWDLESCTVATGLVTAIADQSGNGQAARNLAKVGTNGPTYTAADTNFNGMPSIGDTVANKIMQATFDTAVTQPATWYLVLNQPSNAATTFWRSNAGNFTGSHGVYVTSTGTISMLTHDASLAISKTGFGTGSKVTCAVYNGANTTSAWYSNNSATPFMVKPTDGSLDTDSAAAVTIGSFGSAVTYSWAHMSVYNGVHDATTRALVMNWLGAKYGIAVT